MSTTEPMCPLVPTREVPLRVQEQFVELFGKLGGGRICDMIVGLCGTDYAANVAIKAIGRYRNPHVPERTQDAVVLAQHLRAALAIARKAIFEDKWALKQPQS